MLDCRIRLLLFGMGLIVWCGWVSGFHTDTPAAIATWCVSLCLVVVTYVVLRRAARSDQHVSPMRPALPWPRPGRGGARASLRGLAPWLVLLAIAVAWDVLGIDTGPRINHLTLSALAQAFRPIGAGLLLGWILFGIGYGVARARVPRHNPRGQASGAGLASVAVVPPSGHYVAPELLLPSSRPVGIAFWIAVCLAALVIDGIARRSEGRTATAGELVRFVTTSMLGNVVVIVVWALVGYHLFAR